MGLIKIWKRSNAQGQRVTWSLYKELWGNEIHWLCLDQDNNLIWDSDTGHLPLIAAEQAINFLLVKEGYTRV